MSVPETEGFIDINQVEIVAPHFKRRLSGVTSTVIQLVPVQRALGEKIAVLGPGLPQRLPHIRYSDLLKLWSAPEGATHRIWHARRNIEMLPAIVMRDLLRMKLRILFTSASQRHHTGWTKWLISKMDAVVATSARTATYLDVPSTVIMHGIDGRRFCPPADKAQAKEACGLDPSQKFVGCFGRIRHQKGTDVFIDAMIALLPERPGWSAIIAGRATEKHLSFEEELKEKVKAAGLADRILFVGEHKNIEAWYQALDLFVAPQRWEGFGLTPLEAMASGVPVVATDVGAFPELVIPGQEATGSVVARGSVTDMSTAVSRLLDDDEKRSSAGANAVRHVAEHFQIANEAEQLHAVYAALLGR